MKQHILGNEQLFNQLLHQGNPFAQAIAEDDDIKLIGLVAEKIKREH